MKRLIIILFLLTASVFARPLTDFINPDNGVCYAFVEADNSLLDALIPEWMKWSQIPTGESDAEGNPVMRQKTLREYTFGYMTHDLGNGRSVLLLAAKESVEFTNAGANTNDLAEFETFLTPLGYPSDSWKTIDEWRRDYPQNID